MDEGYVVMQSTRPPSLLLLSDVCSCEGVPFAHKQHPGSLEISLGDQPTPPDVSAVAFAADPGITSLDRTLLTVLFDNGTIAVHWQASAGAAWPTGFAPPTQVAGLAVNYGLQAYCLTHGRIQEWQIDRLLPTSWTLTANVTTALD